MHYQFWTHPKSGDVYAVRLEAMAVTGACGPLYYKDVDAANLPDYEYDREDGKWVAGLMEDQRHRRAWGNALEQARIKRRG